jgi:hypothetical protein
VTNRLDPRLLSGKVTTVLFSPTHGPCDLQDHLAGATHCPLCHPQEMDVDETDLPIELL